MTSKVTDKGGGSKGHNSIEKYNYYVNGVDENVVLSTLVNNIEVTPSNGMDDKQLHELSGISGLENEVLHTVKNLGESCKDMYITSGAHMHDTCSQTVNTLNNVAIDRAPQLSDQNHLMTTCMETTTAKSQISINVKLGLVQLPNYYHGSLFHAISHDADRNADIWYCYIHGYPRVQLVVSIYLTFLIMMVKYTFFSVMSNILPLYMSRAPCFCVYNQ